MARKTRVAKSPQDVLSELGIDLEDKPCEWIDSLMVQRIGKWLLASYLVHDDHGGDDPINSCDGSGRILDGQDRFHHLGRFSDGEPEMEDQKALLTRLGMEDGEAFENAAYEMWCEAWDRGKVGTAHARALVRRYNDGGYDEHDGTDVRGIDACWIPDDSLLEHLNTFPEGEKRNEQAKQCFESALNEFNTWAEGDVYGCVHEEFELIGDDWEQADNDACWGHVGQDWALSALKDDHACRVKWRRKQARKQARNQRQINFHEASKNA